MLTEPDHTIVIQPVHDLYQTVVCRLRIKNTCPLLCFIHYLSTGICTFDPPVFRHLDLIKISGMFLSGNSPLCAEISIYRIHAFRQKSVILHHCCRKRNSHIRKRFIQISAFHRKIIKQQNYFRRLIHRFTTSFVRNACAFS